MTQLYLAYDGGLAVLRQDGTQWVATASLLNKQCHCLAVDPHRPQRVYCGTFDAGLWVSDDAGLSWQPVARALPHDAVTAVAVSPLEENSGLGILWAGTEPSALFRSDDGGRTWQEKTALQAIPSKPTWSFPPRPWTHHVRWIEPDPNVAEQIFVGIELGGVMRSLDGGETWEDRKPNSQHDCHTLRAHPQAPGLLYETAGGGFAESHDGGATWQRDDTGRRHHYLWGLAVDPGDPATVVISGSPGPRGAHNDATAEAQLYRRHGAEAWQPLSAGLPEPRGTRAYVLATHPAEPGVFYAATGQALYRSSDSGLHWEQQQVTWPDDRAYSSVTALVVGG
jgi:photosystem II stability/assembly factor-like uncharacterized protein